MSSLAMAKLLAANPALRLAAWTKQEAFLKSPAQTRLLAWANRCLGAESEIYDPVMGCNRVISEIDGDFNVLAYDESSGDYVVARAQKPFRKGPIEPIYKVVMSSGESFTASGEHLILTYDGYLSIAEARQGTVAFLPASSSEPCRSIPPLGVQSSERTRQGFQDYCQTSPLKCDEPLLQASDTDQALVPLQDDVQACTCCVGREGGSEHKQQHNRLYQDGAHRPSTDDQHQTEGQSVEFECCVACIDSPPCSCNSRLSRLPESVCESQPQLNIAPDQLPNHNSSLPLSLYSCSVITSITYLRDDYKWDCHVPIYNNYYAGGAIHHNTGKTSCGAAEVCLAAEGIHPYSNHLYPKPPFTIWACSVDYKEMRDSVMVSLEGDSTHPRMLPIGTKFKQQEMSYYLPSGSIIRLKSADTGRDSFQGAGLPLVWIDEELPEDILKELFIRIGPGYETRYIWTMTAVKGLSYAYDHFYIPWQAYAEEHGGECHPRIFYSEASMDECPYLTEAQIDSVTEKFPAGSKELQIRRFGGFRDLAGDSVFSQAAIDLHRKQCREPDLQLTYEWDETQQGHWPRQMHVDTKPYDKLVDTWHVDTWRPLDPNDEYVVFADIAVGCQVDPTNEDSPRDWSVVYVFNRSLQQFDAECRCRCDPHTVGKILWLLGHYYNYAWVSPEINSMGIATLGVLTGKTGLPTYGRIYQRKKDFDEWQPEIIADDLGWVTTQGTRGKMISDLYTALEPAAGSGTIAVKVFSVGFVNEMVSFQKNTRTGKPEAIRGRHDDRIMAGAGAIQMDLLCPHGKPSNMAKQTGQPVKGKKFNQAMVEGGAIGTFLVPGEKRRRA